MLTSGVYGIVNLFNDKIYVGSAAHFSDRFSWHYRALENNKHHNKLLQDAWFKYGEDSFIFFVIERTEKLLEREQVWLNRFSGHSYNLYFKAGSPLGTKHTAEAKIKIGDWSRGKPKSAETKAKMAEAARNRSETWRANHSAAMKKRVFSEEHRRKISEANLRRKNNSIDNSNTNS